MIYNTYAGEKISALGLGMMRLPVLQDDDSKIDEKSTAEMIDYAIKNGVNYFDTAWGYHGENSEIAAGNILSNYARNSFYLASKFPGYDPTWTRSRRFSRAKWKNAARTISISTCSTTSMRATWAIIPTRASA